MPVRLGFGKMNYRTKTGPWFLGSLGVYLNDSSSGKSRADMISNVNMHGIEKSPPKSVAVSNVAGHNLGRCSPFC